MKIIFMGTAEFSVEVLKKLMEKHEISLVVTQPDKKVGRKKIITYSAVKQFALKHNIEVFQPVKIKEDFQKILNTKAEIVVTAAYGQLVPNKVLEFTKYKAINVHASLLPKYRGAAPIHRAIYNGDKCTGITIMYMVEKMDAGDILKKEEVEIRDLDTVSTMFEKLSKVGSLLCLKVIEDLAIGKIRPLKQEQNLVSYAKIIKRDEEKIDWQRTTVEIDNHIRAFDSWPGTYTTLKQTKIKIFPGEIHLAEVVGEPGEVVKITKAGILVKTADGGYLLKDLQLAGKKRVLVKDFINGNKLLSINDIFE